MKLANTPATQLCGNSAGSHSTAVVAEDSGGFKLLWRANLDIRLRTHGTNRELPRLLAKRGGVAIVGSRWRKLTQAGVHNIHAQSAILCMMHHT
jgi:hypothetical protein